LPCIAPPRHLIAAAEMTPSGVPPMPISSRRRSRLRGRDRRRDVAVADEVHARARSRSSAMRSSWRSRSSTTTVRSFTAHALRLGDALEVLGRRRVDVDRVRGLGADGDLVHVQRGAGKNIVRARRRRSRRSRSACRGREAVPRAGRRRRRPRARPVADLLAVEEHRRLVLLPSPITTTPRIATVSSMRRMASTAA
jgi:hypothetical protein